MAERAGEVVHQPAVKRKLFISVSVVLVAGIRDAAIDSEWGRCGLEGVAASFSCA